MTSSVDLSVRSPRQKQIALLALKNIITDMGRIPLFSIINNHYNVFYMQFGRSGQRE
jgi:hypothetical protein